MPRIRTIKPEFFEDDKIGTLSYAARLCFIGLWTLADDFGTLNKTPEAIKGQLFPYDYNDPELDVERYLKEFENLGLIIRYGPNKRYIYIVNFHKHQNINRPSKKRSAPPPEDFGVPVTREYAEFVRRIEKREVVVNEPSPTAHGTLTEYSVSTHGVVSEHSVSTHPKEKEMEKERERELGTGKGNWEREEKKDLPVPNGTGVHKTGVLCACPAGEKTDDKKEKPEKLPNCPHKEIVELYHEVLPELPRCMVLSERRKNLIRARWREVLTNPKIAGVFLSEEEARSSPRERGLLWFRRYFERVRESDFLMGLVPPTKDRDAPFKATLEWLMLPSNFAKVLEGFYHRQRSPWADLSPAGRRSVMAAMELLRELEEEEHVDSWAERGVS